MEKLKLVSMRIESQTLEKVEELAKNHDYCKKTSIMSKLLTRIFECADTETIFRMLAENWAFEKGYKITFEVDRKLITERTEQSLKENL